MKSCEKCGSSRTERERRPNGNTQCLSCGRCVSSWEWDNGSAPRPAFPPADAPKKGKKNASFFVSQEDHDLSLELAERLGCVKADVYRRALHSLKREVDMIHASTHRIHAPAVVCDDESDGGDR